MRKNERTYVEALVTRVQTMRNSRRGRNSEIRQLHHSTDRAELKRGGAMWCACTERDRAGDGEGRARAEETGWRLAKAEKGPGPPAAQGGRRDAGTRQISQAVERLADLKG